MIKDWWSSYRFVGSDVEILHKYQNEEEFQNEIPINYQLALPKIYIAEVCAWLRCRDIIGRLPSVREITTIRDRKLHTVEQMVSFISGDSSEEHY